MQVAAARRQVAVAEREIRKINTALMKIGLAVSTKRELGQRLRAQEEKRATALGVLEAKS